ncbi:TRAF2 and NCK-interacting protein kinase-like [Pollicipes pollicipes]|uniref:TRAF2 and NCK-interacting protein kinase-like n=1 Tax=Pollicipes pollicipes TaxID=41117 RepID=UPI0018856D35|nr:TRAF2 and NCK-interacting protein kinase-like [Pollicipes pollicipes]
MGPPPARLCFPSIGRARGRLAGTALTLDKVSRQSGSQLTLAGTETAPEAGTPQGKKELKELKAFELLEQAAEDSSFCSNSSFVSNLLHAASSTPERRPGTGPVELSPLMRRELEQYELEQHELGQSELEQHELGRNVFEITADSAADEATLTPEPGARDDSSAWEPPPERRRGGGGASAPPEPFIFDRAALERQKALLDRELATFRSENALIGQLREEVRQQKALMEQQREEWERWTRQERDKQSRRLEQERRQLAEERAALDREKKLFAEQWKQKETPQIKVLTAKVSELEAEQKRRDGSWAQETTRMRSRLAQLSQERDRLTGLLQQAQQQLARRNARQFSGAAAGQGSNVPERSAARRKPALSRHRSAPDLADGGGSSTSVSTFGGRSSRTSLQDQTGSKKSSVVGSRRMHWWNAEPFVSCCNWPDSERG